MNFITKGINRMKANSLYKERGFDFVKESETVVDEVNAKALSLVESDFELAFDYFLYNYYYSPCAFTANNLLSAYIELINREAELSDNIPEFDFFKSVCKYLEQASKFEDVFDSKEYFITLAEFYLIEDSKGVDKAFNLLSSVPTAYMDETIQYLTGALYFLLGMNDIASKMLENSVKSNSAEIKASASLILAKCAYAQITEEERVELLKTALSSTKSAIITEALRQLDAIGRSELITDIDLSKVTSVLNPDICLILAKVYAKCDRDKLTALKSACEEDELMCAIISSAENGEDIDIEQARREINKKNIEELVDSEMYKMSDDFTRRMMNNELLETVQEEEDFSETDYIVFVSAYLK